MRHLLVALLLVCSLTGYARSAILVSNANGGAEGVVATLEAARTGASYAGKSIVVTSALTQAQSNISGAWPTDRALRVEKGGSINPSTSFTGLPYAESEWFGAVGNGSTDDSAAIKKAISSIRVGGTVSLSGAPTSYKFDNSGGLTSAAVVDKAITIKIDSTIVGTTGGIQANPPYIFKVTADDVLITGKGAIKFSGTSDDTNAGDDTTIPGMVYVTGNRFRVDGITFDTPPKVAVMLYGATDGTVENCKFIGGIASYTTGHTALFGVRIYGGARHKVINNFAGPDANGKKIIDLVFASGGAGGNIISGNHANGIYEKVAYLYGDNNIISNNYINNNTVTAPYRVVGAHNKIIGNTAIDCYGGAQVLDGAGNTISNNTFTGCVQGGISVADSGGVAISGTKIENNYITGTGAVSSDAADGIQVSASTTDAHNISVSGNTVSGLYPNNSTFFQSSIRVQGTAPYFVYTTNVSHNIIDAGIIGIGLIRVKQHTANNNIINGKAAPYATNYGIYIGDGGVASGSDQLVIADNIVKGVTGNAIGMYAGGTVQTTNAVFRNNRSISCTVNGISGLTGTPAGGNYGVGNQYTDAALTGQKTLAASASNTVTHGGIAANASIFLIPSNAAAATLSSGKGVYTGISSTNFNIVTGDGAAAAGGEVYNWMVVQ